MRYYEFLIGSHKIEFFNSFYLKEKVLINGKIKSEKFSVNGTEHFLKINSTEILLQSKRNFFKNPKFKVNLFVNRKLIESKRLTRT